MNILFEKGYFTKRIYLKFKINKTIIKIIPSCISLLYNRKYKPKTKYLLFKYYTQLINLVRKAKIKNFHINESDFLYEKIRTYKNVEF
jgi:hypothetical protein